MSEQQFTLNTDDKGVILIPNSILKDGEKMSEGEVVDLLNEQQATINKVYELLEEADIFSDKATEHDIKAYIELREFDNKDAYYLACGIKKAIKLLKGDDK